MAEPSRPRPTTPTVLSAATLIACCCPRPAGASSRDFCDVEPFFLLPALQPELGQLHALGAFQQAPAERSLARDVPEEQLPLDLEGVVVAGIRHILPAGEKVDGLRDVRV